MRYLLAVVLLSGCATVAPKLSPAEAGLPPEPLAVRELHRLVHARLPHLRLREVTLGVSVDNLTQGVPPVGTGQLICTTGSTPAAAWESPSTCFGTTQAWGITSLSLDSSGSTTTTPAALGWSNWTTAEAIRQSFGDLGTAIQVGFGDRLQMYSYNGLDIIAGRASTTPPAFVSGGGAADGITLTGGTAGIIAASPLHIGATGTAISFSGRQTVTTPTLSPAAPIAANSCAVLASSLTVTGAVANAECIASRPTGAAANPVVTCNVVNTNTVQMQFCNVSTGAVTPSTGTYSVRVFNP